MRLHRDVHIDLMAPRVFDAPDAPPFAAVPARLAKHARPGRTGGAERCSGPGCAGRPAGRQTPRRVRGDVGCHDTRPCRGDDRARGRQPGRKTAAAGHDWHHRRRAPCPGHAPYGQRPTPPLALARGASVRGRRAGAHGGGGVARAGCPDCSRGGGVHPPAHRRAGAIAGSRLGAGPGGDAVTRAVRGRRGAGRVPTP